MARALAPATALVDSVSLFRRRPLGTLCVAFAVLTSVLSVCCGLGLAAAPWFLCELTAIQLGSRAGRTASRTRSWVAAGAVYLGSVWVLGSVAMLAVLAISGEVALASTRSALPLSAELFASLGLSLPVTGLALGLLLPLEHAPTILIERGGRFLPALLESARLVSASGYARSWLTSLSAHALALVPALALVVVALSRRTLGATVGWTLALLPLLALCVAIGRGMLVASYLALSSQLPPRPVLTAAPPRGAVLPWCLLLAAVALGPTLVLASLSRPVELARGTLPASATPLLDLPAREEKQDAYLPDSALRVVLSTRSVRVIASDGGGAGRLALAPGRIARVRVARVFGAGGRAGAAFALEVTRSSGQRHVTFVDEAGVRLDDSLSRRLAGRMPPAAGGLLLLALLWTGTWLARVLPLQAQLHRQAVAAPSSAHAGLFRAAARGAALRLAPAALTSLAIGLRAALLAG